MLDMYLFINPLGSTCYHTEQNILKLGDSLNEKINFNFVPLMNFKTINDVMCRMNIPLNNVDIRNRLSENIYHSSIDFKAASFQGKKTPPPVVFLELMTDGARDRHYGRKGNGNHSLRRRQLQTSSKGNPQV